MQKKGIKEYSALLDLQYAFNIIQDVPLEEFHLLKEGITKHITVKIFNSRSVISREVTAMFQAEYIKMKVFSETPRRPRQLCNLNKFKGNNAVITRNFRRQAYGNLFRQ